MVKERIHTLSGKPVDELDLQGVVEGSLRPDDFRISPDTLIRQAEEAEAAGYAGLGQNLRRAAEISAIPHHEVLEIYDQLRPGRSSRAKLLDLAAHLERTYQAFLTAALVREAAQVYLERGLVPLD
jgi:propanediol dehydratase small subunit